MKVVYIAGPYAAPTADEIARNVRRAVALGRYAAHLGYTPLVPHAQGWAGVYGAADESEAGVRELALRCSQDLAARADEVWIIQRDDGTRSEGSHLEAEAHRLRSGRPHLPRVGRWSLWCLGARERDVDLDAWAAAVRS